MLEGSIVMGVNGDKPVTLTAGQTFYEGPNDIHTVGRNASKTLPAKFLVVLLKDKDAPVLIPENIAPAAMPARRSRPSSSRCSLVDTNETELTIPFGNRALIPFVRGY